MLRMLVLAALGLSLMAQVRTINPPARAESGMPNFAVGPRGEVYLSWTDWEAEGRHALRYARWTGGGWTNAETVAEGAGWFVNWADFGMVHVTRDGGMLGFWLPRAKGGGKFGYGIQMARRDGAGKWVKVFGAGLEEKEDYAGFVSFVPGEAGAVYLAPPAGGASGGGHGDGHEHRKTLRYVEFDGAGKVVADRELDGNTCSCCPTATVKAGGRIVTAYRDRLEGEIRDISVVRRVEGRWSEPAVVARDGWEIHGCPTDGPAMVGDGKRVAVAWMTRAGGAGKLQVAFSGDGGERFGKPVRVDGGGALGRPALAAAGSGYVLAWLEKGSAGSTELRMRKVEGDGGMGKAMVVAKVGGGRASGFPKVAVAGEDVLVAWRGERVRVGVVKLNLLEGK